MSQCSVTIKDHFDLPSCSVINKDDFLSKCNVIAKNLSPCHVTKKEDFYLSPYSVCTKDTFLSPCNVATNDESDLLSCSINTNDAFFIYQHARLQ